MSAQSAIVVGGGVIGLTSALRLLERGFAVTVIARDLPPGTTSDVAAAIWYVYAVQPLERAVGWANVTLAEYQRQMADYTKEDTGLSWVSMWELSAHPVEKPWWQGLLEDARPLLEGERPPGYVDGYAIRVPLIDPSRYLPFLLRAIERLGGRVVQQEIASLDALDAPLIVHCAGVGARALAADDAVYPIRGQVVRVDAPSLMHGYMDEDDAAHPTYIIPRGHDVLLGGTAVVDDWDSTISVRTQQAILERCAALAPELTNAPLCSAAVGLRPGRRAVRLERETHGERTIIHNYGHGGAGFTLCWGCADEVAALAE